MEPIVRVDAAGCDESAAIVIVWPDAKVKSWPWIGLASEIELNEIAPVPEMPVRLVAPPVVEFVAEDSESA